LYLNPDQNGAPAERKRPPDKNLFLLKKGAVHAWG
jgi:hypothetical protein